VWLLQLLTRGDAAPDRISGAISANVVPEASLGLEQLCRRYFKTDPLVVGAKDVDLGAMVRIDRPEEVGADRIVNTVAAHNRYGGPAIVIDFGTATTFDVVDAAGDYRGGVICPGVNLSLDALHSATAKLPGVAVARPDKVIGASTVGAMQSGVFWGYVGLIEGLIERIADEADRWADDLGHDMKTIATGGLATLFSRATDRIDYLDRDLTLLGLRHIYMHNQRRDRQD